MKNLLLVLILVLATFALAACKQQAIAINETQPTQAGLTRGCSSTPTGTKLLKNQAHGYCLLYPMGYDVMYPSGYEMVLAAGSLLNVEQPRAYINAQDAAGRTAEQVADELAAEFAVGSDVRRTSVMIDGEEAVVLDNVPGQDTSRQVVVVHDDRLYVWVFVPVGEDYGEVYTQMEDLYATVIDSFTFLPREGIDAHSPAADLPPGPRLAVQRPDNSIRYITLDGASAVLVSDAPASLIPPGFDGLPMTDGPMIYVRQWYGNSYALDTLLGQLFPLDFIPPDSSPLAVRPLTEGWPIEGQPISLAWGEFSTLQTASARLYLTAPDGSYRTEALEETYDVSDPWTRLVPWRWRQDGRLYFTKEPIGGLGGFLPFTGAANLWVFDLQSGNSQELISDDVTGGELCLDAVGPEDLLVAHHCDEGRITLLSLETGEVTAVSLPDQMTSDMLLGSVRFRSDGSRIAFAAMTGGIGLTEETRGYVAVSDGLSGGSHIVTTSEPGEYFKVVTWLADDRLLLQSFSAGPDGWPAVWTVRTDGRGLVKLTDGVFLAIN